MVLQGFHPAVRAWFEGRFGEPSEAQTGAWPAIRAGQHALVAAPTGSGKTLAAFLSALDDLVRLGLQSGLSDETHVVYVSPLKALSNDIERNLREPLAGIRRELAARGLPDVDIRTFVRTGDTPAREREAMARRPPHIVVTTPESLYILLTSRRGRDMLRTTRTVIVDEIHALVGSKRGSHLALSLERLEALAGRRLTRIGLSATQRPIETVARFLVGARGDACTILDTGHVRRLDVGLEMPQSPLDAVMAGEVWTEVYDRIAALAREHRTTLVFVNTRRLAERVARHLSERLGENQVAAHHGSLSRDQRLTAEQRLKSGELQALVATASLELGIDIGDVDLVCQIGATRGIATFLQRVGRSGHGLGRVPKGRLFPLSRDELVECVALLDAVRRGELDAVSVPAAPLDILAQQLVACAACDDWAEDDLFTLVRGAFPYRDLARADFDAVLRMLSDGFVTARGRRAAHVHRDAVHHRVRGRRGARIVAITGGGAIPDNADYQVVLEPAGTVVGTLHEDFAIESMAGDIFQLGNMSWRILRVENGRVRVEDARGESPTVPFWLGEAPSRTPELSAAVSRLRSEVEARLPPAALPREHGANPEPSALNGLDTVIQWLVQERGICEPAAQQVVEYLAAAHAALGVLPTQETVVLERFFDEAGGMQLVLHAPFGSRLNRAWGLALRKRFCRKFNFELQAAATEDAIILSLGPTHSFPIADVFGYLSARGVRDVLEQALLAAPMFATRWRWNATRSLAVPRFRNGRKVPANLLRMQTDDLLTLVFPDQVACAENLAGAREIPDHPLVAQTVRDCLEEAMDLERLEALLEGIAAGNVRCVARDTTEPSPLAQEILNSRPYTFLDDAPLEERRTRAVLARRWLDPASAADLGALDAAAIERVRDEAWPDAVNDDELHDALVLLGFLTETEGLAGENWRAYFETLVKAGRATRVVVAPDVVWWVAAERLPVVRAIFPVAELRPELEVPAELAREWERGAAIAELVRGRMDSVAAVTALALAGTVGVFAPEIDAALLQLEADGSILRGHFTPGLAPETLEWCERRLLARIHRATLQRLRAEIEPVAASDFVRFLLAWQHAGAEERLEGPQSTAVILEQLEGIDAPAAAWETEILPLRIADYEPAWLDASCTAGRTTWIRRVPPRAARADGPVRSTPIALVARRNAACWAVEPEAPVDEAHASSEAQAVEAFLATHGAAFFDDLVAGTRLLRTQTERALGELVALGRVSSDSFAGLRALLVPSNERPSLRAGAAPRRRRLQASSVEDAGRWTLVRRATARDPASLDTIVQTLLGRWGVVFRRVADLEEALPPWRDLLRVLRRLEARGDVRGGRFVAGFTGEQFALPDAVGRLRDIRRTPAPGALVTVSASDPLNVTGVLIPGARVPALTGNRVLFRDGVPIAVREGGEIRILAPLEPADEWRVRQALVRRPGARTRSSGSPSSLAGIRIA